MWIEVHYLKGITLLYVHGIILMKLCLTLHIYFITLIEIH